MSPRKPLSIEVSQVLKLLMYTLFGLLISSSAYFFVKMSFTAESGYALHQNQLRQKNLETENRLLKQRLLDAQSLDEVQQSKVVKGMEQPETQTYVLPKGPLSRKK